MVVLAYRAPTRMHCPRRSLQGGRGQSPLRFDASHSTTRRRRASIPAPFAVLPQGKGAHGHWFAAQRRCGNGTSMANAHSSECVLRASQRDGARAPSWRAADGCELAFPHLKPRGAPFALSVRGLRPPGHTPEGLNRHAPHRCAHRARCLFRTDADAD